MEETGQATLIGRRRGQSYSSHQSPFSVWKSYILALTRHLMSNYLWTCQFQQGFCVFKYKGSMTKTPSWSSVLKSLRSLCCKCSGLFAHFTDEKLSIRGCHLPGKQLASGIGIQMQVSWLLLGRSSPSTERKGQPWLHGLGITVLCALSSSRPRSSVFRCVIYFMMIIIGLLLWRAIVINPRPLPHSSNIHPSAIDV